MEGRLAAPDTTADGEESCSPPVENTRDGSGEQPERAKVTLVEPDTRHDPPQQDKQPEQVEENQELEQSEVVTASQDLVLDQDPGPEAMPQPEADEAAHPTTADRVPFYSWGSASEPSIPSVDSNEPFVVETFVSV